MSNNKKVMVGIDKIDQAAASYGPRIHKITN